MDANSGGDFEMTQEKCLNLCTAVDVLPVIHCDPELRVLLLLLTIAGGGDGQLQQAVHEVHWHGRLSRPLPTTAARTAACAQATPRRRAAIRSGCP